MKTAQTKILEFLNLPQDRISDIVLHVNLEGVQAQVTFEISGDELKDDCILTDTAEWQLVERQDD